MYPNVYLRNTYIPSAQASLSIASSPVLYGLAVYTVFNAAWNEKERASFLFRLRDHYQRLGDSAKIMDFAPIDTVIDFQTFVSVAKELIIRNDIKEDALIRAALFIDEEIAGTRTYGLTTSFSAYAYPMGEILPRSGAHLCVSSWQRTSDNAIPSRAKINGSYINATLMKNEALRNGYDDAIALDASGQVAESTVANLFLVRNGRLITPHSATDILEGITRNTVLTLAKEAGLNVTERNIDRSELYLADEAFLCGSSARLTPILSIDKRPISTAVGPITQKIQAKYEAVARGFDETHKEWLTQIN